jgi:hypothetical protein
MKVWELMAILAKANAGDEVWVDTVKVCRAEFAEATIRDVTHAEYEDESVCLYIDSKEERAT